ncbi:MAG TPA: serine kinase [Nitrospirae bacterium]|nr:DRTGG domain protein [bacterium BMS3Abin10]GBE38012.1 DRTGG domain protein [bacterium BMS3Bbin08]HDH00240.1 serine kinase [Nitrospirota bacterium]HDH50634.1 serine kinase [Nitrospirota bacterium]HDO25144.1 serine kinase [Nitrospirota bacterium]
MKLEELVKELSLDVRSGSNGLEKEITGGYASDLLSDVMTRSQPGNVWITLQTHPNIVAVASMKDITGVIIVVGREPQEETLNKAIAENVTIMTTPMTTFETVGKIYELLNKKT